jgi:hypothetical protein
MACFLPLPSLLLKHSELRNRNVVFPAIGSTHMKDLNKSKLTENVTEAVIVWLKEKGLKPVQTEVRIANGWVADIASILRPT